MKELWSVVIEKLKQLEPTEALIGVGVFGVITLVTLALVTAKFLNVLAEILTAFGGKPHP